MDNRINMKSRINIKTKSLLSRTLMQFLICLAVIFLLTTPLFYMLTKLFYAEDMIDIIESVENGNGIPPLDLERDIMAGMMLQFILIFLVISLSLFITLRFITKKLWQPFNKTLQIAEQFNLAQGEFPSFPKTNIREFNRLNHSIEKLMTKDKETFRIQKEFTENASHELQTPLAITRIKLDLLMQEDLNERQMQLVADIYNQNTRMGHLNRSLLLLAKIDNTQYSEYEEVDLLRFTNDLLPSYRTLQGNASISLRNERSKKTTLRANKTLLESLLNNLVVNAIRHTGGENGGEIILTISDNQLTISNTAHGGALSKTDVFRRFHKDIAMNSGNGLGLSIVKAICNYHGWKIEYEFESNRHIFIIGFK